MDQEHTLFVSEGDQCFKELRVDAAGGGVVGEGDDEHSVTGLTTAAGLWAVAAIGMTAGSGLVWGAVAATAIALAILYGLGLIEEVLRDRRAAGVVRPFGVRLETLDELTEVVTMTCTLDDQASHVGVDRTEGEEFLVSFDLQVDKIPTVVAALAAFESVVEAAEMDPK